LFIGTGFERFDELNFMGNTMAEIRRYLQALRQKANDVSITGSMGCLIYINSNTPQEGEKMTDFSVFLPYRAEYIEAQQRLNQSRIRLTAGTARIILAHKELFSSKANGVYGQIVDEVEQIANT
jgi:hypothetical protein